MFSFIAILITVLLGIIGLVAKTKKDGNPGYFNKLTPFGFAVLSLLVISSFISVWMEYNKQLNADKARAAEEKKVFEDSTAQAMTIESLRGQEKLLLQQIEDDEKRFDTTLESFALQLSKQNKTLQNTVTQLNKQEQTLHEIYRTSNTLDNVGLYYQLRYSLEDEEVNKYADDVKNAALAIARRDSAEGFNNAVSNSERTSFTINDNKNKMLIAVKIQNKSMSIQRIELAPNSPLIPQGHGLDTNGADIFGEVKLSFEFFRGSPKDDNATADLKLWSSGWNADKMIANNRNASLVWDPNHLEPSAIGLMIEYGGKYILQRVYTTDIRRDIDLGNITVPDLKNATLVIRRPSPSESSGKGSFDYLSILWGPGLSRRIVLNNRKLQWVPSEYARRKMVYTFDGSETTVF